MKTISETIKQILREPKYPFHMPGHKRNDKACCQGDFCQYDFTEIDGLDNLYAPEGIILESERRAAEFFGADRSFYLVNGSTAGIIASILAAADNKDSGCRMLICPDAHKSVYSALELGGLTGVDCEGKSFDCREDRPAVLTGLKEMSTALGYEKLPARIESVLNAQPGIRAVVVTSPNYEGIVSDIRRIAGIAHSHGAVLIVDEAHGTHFGMDEYFPENSNRLGADIVIHSMHKTMCALTQTALLHVNGGRVDTDRVLAKLQMIQTSSPSYLLMKSIDDCIALLNEKREELFTDYVRRLRAFRRKVDSLEHISLFSGNNAGGNNVMTDPGKLVITLREFADSGDQDAVGANSVDMRDIYRALREQYDIQLEFAQKDHALAMTSFADTDEGFDRLAAALEEIDRSIAKGEAFSRGSADEGSPAADECRPVSKTDCYEP